MTRRADDSYFTPEWTTRRFLEAVDLPGGRWLEPAAGDGAIIRATWVQRSDIKWDAIELRDTPENRAGLGGVNPDRIYFGDFLEAALSMVADGDAVEPYDVVVSNPPFSLAMEFVQASLLLGKHVVMLLRLAFLESEERAEFLRENPPNVYVLPNRPSFTDGTHTDSSAYGWFHWPPERNRERGSVKVLALTPKELRR